MIKSPHKLFVVNLFHNRKKISAVYISGTKQITCNKWHLFLWCFYGLVWFMVLNTTVNNISFMSLWIIQLTKYVCIKSWSISWNLYCNNSINQLFKLCWIQIQMGEAYMMEQHVGLILCHSLDLNHGTTCWFDIVP